MHGVAGLDLYGLRLGALVHLTLQVGADGLVIERDDAVAGFAVPSSSRYLCAKDRACSEFL